MAKPVKSDVSAIYFATRCAFLNSPEKGKNALPTFSRPGCRCKSRVEKMAGKTLRKLAHLRKGKAENKMADYYYALNCAQRKADKSGILEVGFLKPFKGQGLQSKRSVAFGILQI